MARPFERLRREGEEGAQPEAATEVVPAVGAEAADGETVTSDAAAGDAGASGAAEETSASDAPTSEEPGAEAEAQAEPETAPAFLARGQLRRRLRYVRRAREVALRDLGGLVFELHRFGRDRTDLVDRKLTALTALDAEMRALEGELDDRRDVTVLREPGLATCPRCGGLHASDARFCSSCGLALGDDGDGDEAATATDEPPSS